MMSLLDLDDVWLFNIFFSLSLSLDSQTPLTPFIDAVTGKIKSFIV